MLLCVQCKVSIFYNGLCYFLYRLTLFYFFIKGFICQFVICNSFNSLK
uniref:Uncharacterized protein n=1 Tax=Phage sp. ctgh419 TaxID=2828009 RepID=A0A8S5SL33_9VIRU|nr:MAG TPA: hypothetical protein [Phage sp. ctgh419]